MLLFEIAYTMFKRLLYNRDLRWLADEYKIWSNGWLLYDNFWNGEEMLCMACWIMLGCISTALFLR